MVLSNGSRIMNKENIKYRFISKQSSKRILDFIKENEDNTIIIETLDMAYSNKNVDYLETIISSNLDEIIKTNKILKIMIEIKNEETLNLLKPYINDDVYYSIANGIGKVIQIMNKKATKWDGIKTILKLNKIDPKKCIYFGDDNDDIIPLQKCGMGVCPENAIDECKKVSDHICKTNDEDGVAHFLEEFILKENI
jgi:hydroxymethylpyrimidine pyrophosphatase-like HAD family hydrolase